MRGAVAWESLAHLPVVLAATVACVVAAVLIYRPQLRRAGWFWRWTVPGFRVTAIVALLGSALRPSILRPAAPEDLGAVVIVLDDSASMSVSDSSWTPAELVELADALHELPPGVSRWSGRDFEDHVARVRPLIDEAARASSELEYARVAGRSVESAGQRATQTRAALISACNALAGRAASASPGLKATLSAWSDVGPVIDTKGRAAWAELRSRADATIKAIDAFQTESDASLYAANAQVRGACDGLARLSRIDLARRAVERTVALGMSHGVPVRIVAASNPTNALVTGTGAITRALVPAMTADALSPDIGGAVRLLSQQSGRDHRVRSVLLFSDGRYEETAMHALTGLPPVIACRTTPAAVRDTAIRQVVTPDVAYVGDGSTVRVDLLAKGYSGSKVTVRVACDGKVETREVAVDADHVSADVPFLPASAGVSQLSINIEPLPGEATVANNSTDRYVRVLAGRVPVLALTPEGSTGPGTLADVLSHVSGATTKVIPVDNSQYAVIPAADILVQRVIILHDVSAESLSAEQIDAIRELVTARGGTLVLIAGRSHWPLDDRSESLLDDLLPYRLTSFPTWRSALSRSPVPTADAGVPPALLRLPASGRFLDLGELRAGVRPLVVDQETGSPLMTEAAVGSGRVIMITTDDAAARGATGARSDTAQFWAGLVRYVADRPYAAEADGCGLDSDRPDIGSGETVNVRAHVPATGPAGTPTRPPTLFIMADDHVVRSEPLASAGPESEGRFTATVGSLLAGDYTIRLDTGIDDELAPILDVPLHVRSAKLAELADVSPDLASLRELVEPTGGVVVPITEAGRLAAEALRGRADRPRTVEYALWDSPYLFLFVTACLTAEWALRKRLGLA